MMGRSKLFALGAALGLTACTGSGYTAPIPSASPRVSIEPPSPQHGPIEGGSATFGTVFWAECVNPVSTCYETTYAHWLVFQHVLPRAMELDANGNFVASPLLVEAPTLENDGVEVGPPFSVTYRIDPRAVWDDGTPITSNDFRFTWKAFVNTFGAYDATGYQHIASIDTRDPRIAVVRFDHVYPDWPDVFGGPFGYLIKASAFPSVDPDHPDLSDMMQDEIPFSGGPFRLVEWDQTHEVLVRNDRFFGTRARLDQVTFVPSLGALDGEIQSLVNGDVAAIYPPMGFGGKTIEEAFGRTPEIQVKAGDGTLFEALWFGHRVKPMNDPHVREALMYALDRESVVDEVVRPWNPDAQVLNCGFVAVPTVGPWCASRPFERFSYDPARSRSILEAAGYECSGEYCTRDGKRLEIEMWVADGNDRRARTQEILVDGAKAAGIALVSMSYDCGPFPCDQSRFAISDYATVADTDPQVTEMFACDQFRTRMNPSGRNWTHWCNPAAEQVMREADAELDPDRRLQLMNLAYSLQALDFVSLPLYAQPVVSAWRSDQIGGPIGLYNSSPHGLFFNMNEWYLIR
jgi:peptide/nickel transport system substrate-binding protein